MSSPTVDACIHCGEELLTGHPSCFVGSSPTPGGGARRQLPWMLSNVYALCCCASSRVVANFRSRRVPCNVYRLLVSTESGGLLLGQAPGALHLRLRASRPAVLVAHVSLPRCLALWTELFSGNPRHAQCTGGRRLSSSCQGRSTLVGCCSLAQSGRSSTCSSFSGRQP